MKKVVLLLAVLLATFSCSKDELKGDCEAVTDKFMRGQSHVIELAGWDEVYVTGLDYDKISIGDAYCKNN